MTTQEAANEFQQQVLNTQNSLFSFMRQQEQVQAQLQATTYQIRHKDATTKALNEIPNAPLYKSVGKVYYAAPRDEQIAQMKKDMEKATQEMTILKNTQVYVDKKAKETEQRLTELLKQVQMEQK
ncbi:Prefoldin_subunit [Hexamita inflata]|uniref:Prefoldin subunit n=1 Tax=Hexamita inflata TaxID=28002 RepID=A0AA86Q7T1_9EUKA|nr:Prefoldin subunit [Hexamita inflata]CAI9950977.1 Prefoldin subunit [Hexamita inflata]CAI9964728.1 Prefoldin subunit [Hexamita inflata]